VCCGAKTSSRRAAVKAGDCRACRYRQAAFPRFDINALVDETLTRAYYNARAELRGFTIKLERSFDPTAGNVDVFPWEITRALLNLISNGFYAATKRKAEAKGDDHEPDEQSGSQSYVPDDEKDDRALQAALDLLRGVAANAAFPPNSKPDVSGLVSDK
jgi:hypothetical protein